MKRVPGARMEDNELVFCAHDTGQPVHVTLTSSGILFDRSLRAICCEYGVRLRHEALKTRRAGAAKS